MENYIDYLNLLSKDGLRKYYSCFSMEELKTELTWFKYHIGKNKRIGFAILKAIVNLLPKSYSQYDIDFSKQIRDY